MTDQIKTPERIKTKMQELISEKERDYALIETKRAAALKQLKASEEALEAASANMDAAAFDQASQEKHRAETVLAMCAAKSEQIKAHRYISEAESDQVIDELLAYEDQLAADFVKAAGKLLDKLDECQKNYAAEVQEVEQIITTWCSQIHPNYRARHGTTYYRDGKQTDRADRPIPVHNDYAGGYKGCQASILIENNLYELREQMNYV